MPGRERREATHTGAPRLAINAAWTWVALTVMFLLFRQLVEGEREVRTIAAVMIALAVALSSFGFYQFFYSIPRDQARYAADPEGALRERTSWRPWLAATSPVRQSRQLERADGHICWPTRWPVSWLPG